MRLDEGDQAKILYFCYVFVLLNFQFIVNTIVRNAYDSRIDKLENPHGVTGTSSENDEFSLANSYLPTRMIRRSLIAP